MRSGRRRDLPRWPARRSAGRTAAHAVVSQCRIQLPQLLGQPRQQPVQRRGRLRYARRCRRSQQAPARHGAWHAEARLPEGRECEPCLAGDQPAAERARDVVQRPDARGCRAEAAQHDTAEGAENLAVRQRARTVRRALRTRARASVRLRRSHPEDVRCEVLGAPGTLPHRRRTRRQGPKRLHPDGDQTSPCSGGSPSRSTKPRRSPIGASSTSSRRRGSS